MRLVVTVQPGAVSDWRQAGEAFAAGWQRRRPKDRLRVLPLGRDAASVRAAVEVMTAAAAPAAPAPTPIVVTEPLAWGSAVSARLREGAATALLPLVGAHAPEFGSWMRLALGALAGAQCARDASANASAGPLTPVLTHCARLLRGAPLVLLACDSRALAGADSLLAERARTDPAAADALAARLLPLLEAAEEWAPPLRLAERPAPGRWPGGGGGGGAGEALARMGAHIEDAASWVAQAIGLPAAVGETDLQIHVASSLTSWDVEGGVAAFAAGLAQQQAVPTVVVAGEVAISARERGQWGIDGALCPIPRDREGVSAYPLGPAQLHQAATRLAPTWGID